MNAELGDGVLWTPMLPQADGTTVRGHTFYGVVRGIRDGILVPKIVVQPMAVVTDAGLFRDATQLKPIELSAKYLRHLTHMDAGRTELEARWLVYSALGHDLAVVGDQNTPESSIAGV